MMPVRSSHKGMGLLIALIIVAAAVIFDYVVSGSTESVSSLIP